MAQSQPAKQKNAKKMTVSEVLRQAKIDILKENVDFANNSLEKLRREKDALLAQDISGAKVTHKVFGQGKIVSHENMSLCAKFDVGEKRFVVPNAFTDGFLTTNDKTLANLLLQYDTVCQKIDKLENDISTNLVSISLLEKK